MNKLLKPAIAGLMLAGASLPVNAETWNVSIIAGHPPLTAGVALLSSHFVPEVTRRVAELGHTINFTEAYAGAVAPADGCSGSR